MADSNTQNETAWRGNKKDQEVKVEFPPRGTALQKEQQCQLPMGLSMDTFHVSGWNVMRHLLMGDWAMSGRMPQVASVPQDGNFFMGKMRCRNWEHIQTSGTSGFNWCFSWVSRSQTHQHLIYINIRARMGVFQRSNWEIDVSSNCMKILSKSGQSVMNTYMYGSTFRSATIQVAVSRLSHFQQPNHSSRTIWGDAEPSKHTEKYGVVWHPVGHTWLITIVPTCPLSRWHGASMSINVDHVFVAVNYGKLHVFFFRIWGFHEWWYPNSWMVLMAVQIQSKMEDWGVPPF